MKTMAIKPATAAMMANWNEPARVIGDEAAGRLEWSILGWGRIG